MKYLVVLYIAFGLVSSMVVGIEYTCTGDELFPEYYGSPFAFKVKSLATPMQYNYSISGLILNVLTWSSLLFFLRFVVISLIKNVSKNRIQKIAYKVLVGILIAFSTFSIAMETVF